MTGVQTVHDPIARAVIECAADAIVAVDDGVHVTVWNPAAERMFGWSAAEVLGRPLPIVPDELMAEHNAVQERLLTRRGGEGGQISIATRRFRRDGRLIDVRIDTSLLLDGDGAPLGLVGVYHPVEEDEVAQYHTAERARLVRRLNDIVADLNAELDLDVVLDRITAALIELTGADAGGFVRIEGERLRLVSLSGLPDHMRGTTADLRTSLVGELLRSGRAVRLATGEQRLGDLIWSELPGLHTVALGLSFLQNRPYGALYALFSGRKVGHRELELLELLAGHAGVAVGNAVAYAEVVRQRAHERAVIDSSADGIAVLDRDGLVRQWNPAAHALTGIAPEQALGRELPFEMPALGEMITIPLPESGVWLNVLAAEIEETDELVVDFRDVTEAKALEEAKDLFLATTSHELRTPVTVVQGFASTLSNRWDEMSDADRRSAVAIIAERAQSLGRLVEHLLRGARAGADELGVTIESFDLVRVLEGVVAGFRSLSDLHRVGLEIAADLPQARGDALATDIVLGQLLENAFKYSPDGGRIMVRARCEGDEVVVTVDDEGIGIAPGDHDRIFERFVQGEAGDRRRFGGIGLGLYIVKRLTEAQGGEISAHQVPPSEPGRTGTRMCLKLKIAETVHPLGVTEITQDLEVAGGSSVARES
ncbi:hypothetical protein GCM10010191_74850 [Actinomadura vinacea]|uniref:Sensor-like histidine kinase SenX3 n=1 Tax=Actinomadura vinacea TaxID=115336 RepID=A0ABP5X6G9_9ACTN